MATFTTKQYIDHLNRQIARIDKFKKKEFAIVRKSFDGLITRVFEKGINGRGQALGQYRGGELYVNARRGARRQLSPRGKPGSERNVQDRKTRYFPSYRAFKAEVRTLSGRVDLQVFGDLKTDFQTSLTPTKTGYVTGLKRGKNIGKFKGAVDKYGTVAFQHSKKELSDLNKRLGTLFLKYLNFEL